MGTNDETMRGKVSRAFVYRCARCPRQRVIEARDGKCNADVAVIWARGEGWSKTAAGWVCPQCKTQHAAKVAAA